MKYPINFHYKVWNMMPFLWIILFLICSHLTLQAQVDYTIETVPNVRLSDQSNHVSNPDTLLAFEYVDSINFVLNVLEDSTGIETAVVAVKSIGENDARQFATELFNHWKPGKKGEDNGLLILLVANPLKRTIAFETGYGIEGDLPDAICKRIQQENMIPYMKDGNYGAGMYKGVQAVTKYLHGDISIVEDDLTEEELIDREGAVEKADYNGFWVDVLLGLFLLVLVIIVVFHKLLFGLIGYFFVWLWRKIVPRKCPECGKRTLKLEKDVVARKATFKAKGYGYEIYVCKNCGHTVKEKYTLERLEHVDLSMGSDDDKRRRRGGSSSSGGGGSWGGGSSGGGGASSDF